jgi:hypothetical protein
MSTRDAARRNTRIARLGGISAVLLASAVLAVAVRAEPPTMFTAVDLGTLGGQSSGAVAITDAGQVVG